MGVGGGDFENGLITQSLFFVLRPATAPAPRQENVRREFSLDFDGIEGDDHHNDVSVPQLETNEALEDLISAPVQKPYTKLVCFLCIKKQFLC